MTENEDSRWKAMRRGKHGQSRYSAYYHETVRHILIQHMEKYERGYETIVNRLLAQARYDGTPSSKYDRLVDFWRPEYIRAIVRNGRFVASEMLEPLVAYLRHEEVERCKSLDFEPAMARFGETLADMLLLPDDQTAWRQAIMRQNLQIQGIFVSNLTEYGDHSGVDWFEDSQIIALLHVPGQSFLRMHVIAGGTPVRQLSGVAIVGDTGIWCFARENGDERHFHLFSLFPSDRRFAKKAVVTLSELLAALSGTGSEGSYDDYWLLQAPLTDWLMASRKDEVEDSYLSISPSEFMMSARRGSSFPVRGLKKINNNNDVYGAIIDVIDRMGWRMS